MRKRSALLPMMRFIYGIATIVGGIALNAPSAAAPIIYNDEAAFRAAAGPTTTYGFETHGVVEGAELAFDSPISAAQLDNNFDLAHTNFNGLKIIDDGAAPGVAGGTHYLFTHSVGNASDYTLSFANFGGSYASTIAFGITITDFASNIIDNDPVTITYDTGGLAGTLLTVIGGQPDYTQNFVGLIVDAFDAFTSITITLNDNSSGFQDFDEVIYSRVAQVPEPASVVLVLTGLVSLAILGRRRRANGWGRAQRVPRLRGER